MSTLPIEILVIDDGRGLPQRVRGALAQAAVRCAPRTVDGVLMALGEASRPTQPSAPSVLVTPLEKIAGDAAAFAQALRQVAPQLRLVAVSDHATGESIEAAAAAGYLCLTEPASPQQWAGALAASPGSASSSASAPPSEARSALAAPGADSPTQPARGCETSTGTTPGDGDVFDALLHPHGRPRDAALTLIRRETGLPAVEFVAEPAGEIAGQWVVPVVHQQRRFGALTAPAAAAREQLEPWARWLGSVLALHQQQQDLWYMAMRDELTGAWNRRYFQRFLRAVLKQAEQEQRSVTLLLFDIDDFKRYNDRYGHDAGDEILRETVKLIRSVVRTHDVVARIGGDEFAVVFWDRDPPRRANSQPPSDVLKVAERFRKAILAHKFPKLGAEAKGALTISGGLATFPADGQTPETLIIQADAAALNAKRQGKNAIRLGPDAPAERGSFPQSIVLRDE